MSLGKSAEMGELGPIDYYQRRRGDFNSKEQVHV